MNKILSTVCIAMLAGAAHAQITITASDMPVLNDTLRSSTASATTNLNLSNTGANVTWDYTSLVAQSQKVDHYQAALSVSINYALISLQAYGYKVADSIPGLSSVAAGLPVTVSNIYTFFVNHTTAPSSFNAEGFGASVSGTAIPAVYSAPDKWYIFPLHFSTPNTTDSSAYAMTATVPNTATLTRKGYRKTTVDGWGTIKTPYFPNGVAALRVRSEVVETDSVNITLLNMALPNIPLHTVEYKWLANGEHYPALWVTSNITGSGSAATETPTNVSYRDSYRQLAPTSVGNEPVMTMLEVYPNPATNGIVTIKIPASWANYSVEIFDAQGKLVLSSKSNTVNVSSFANGNYFVRVLNNGQIGLAQIVK